MSASSFAQIRADLIIKISQEARAEQPNNWAEAPERVFRENEGLVESLFNCAESTQQEKANRESRFGKSLGNALRSKHSEISRYRILAIMLCLDLDLTSHTWKSFVKDLDKGRLSPGFSDQNLPFERETIKHFLGETSLLHISGFEKAQWVFAPPFSHDFESKLRHLQDSLHQKLTRCEIKDGGGSKLSDLPTDLFLPKGLEVTFFKEEREYIKNLYLEGEKARLAEKARRENYSPSERHKAITRAEEVQDQFLQGAENFPKVLTTLILMDMKPNSKIWQSFVSQCLRYQPNKDVDVLSDTDLPVVHSSLLKRLPCEIWECHSFCQAQYALCAIELLPQKPINVAKHGASFRLPLKKKEKIGQGAFGHVYGVRVQANHYDPVDKDLAMKSISLREGEATPIEWRRLERLFKMPIEHKSITRALAGVQTHNAMLIFFERADCDLDKYMTKERTHIKSDQDRLKLLTSIVDIAYALKYLHIDMRDSNHKRIVYYHKDIKAQNILVKFTEDDGIAHFYLTDFGISSVIEEEAEKKEALSTGTCWTLRAHFTANQQGDNCGNIAPEARNDGRVNDRTDIWGYGSVLADFIPWLVEGNDGLQEFYQARKSEASDDSVGSIKSDVFWKIENEVPVLKSAVAKWYDGRVEKTENKTHASLYKKCWRLLKERIFVCEPDHRAEIVEVYEELCDILHSFDHDIDNVFDSESDSNFSEDLAPPESMYSRAAAGQHMAEMSARRFSATANHRPSSRSHSSTSSNSEYTKSAFAQENPTTSSSSSGGNMQGGRRPSSSRSARHRQRNSGESSIPRRSLDRVDETRASISTGSRHRPSTDSRDVAHPAGPSSRATSISSEAQQTDRALLLHDLKKAITNEQDDKASRIISELDSAPISDEGFLHRAARKGMVATIRQLLTNNMSIIESPDQYGYTALMAAYQSRQESAVRMLVEEYGAQLDVKNKDGLTMLHLAAKHGQFPLELILQKHPNLKDQRDTRWGDTPLHHCANELSNEALHVAELLLNAGASLQIPNNKKETPEGIVMQADPSKNRDSMLRLFRARR